MKQNNFFLSLGYLAIGLILPLSACSQITGCTDPQALNFDAFATQNDGSCVYEKTEYALTKIADLSPIVQETSNLLFLGDVLWTTNDSGGAPFLYKLNLQGELLDSVRVENAENKDWEALAQSESSLFIGDFGNNMGNRQDLRIYKIAKNTLGNASVQAEIIEFYYPEQDDFTPQNMATSWDAEAFLYANDSLHVFTKDWINGKTAHYTIPSNPGSYAAKKRGEMEVNGLITDATLSPSGDCIALLGYELEGFTGFQSFVWLLWDYPSHQIFNGNKRRLELGNTFSVGQTEGICFTTEGKGFITGEAISSSLFSIDNPAMLHSFDWLLFLENMSKVKTEENPLVRVYPNPADTILFFENSDKPTKAIITNAEGKTMWKGKIKAGKNCISVGNWTRGSYLLTFKNGESKTIILK